MTLLSQDNTLSAATLAEQIGITAKAVEKQIAALKADGVLRRIGPDKGGYWQVVEKRIDFWRERSLPPAFSLCFKKAPLLWNIRTAYGPVVSYCLYAVSFLLYRLFRRSLVSAAVSLPCTDVKGERFSG